MTRLTPKNESKRRFRRPWVWGLALVTLLFILVSTAIFMLGKAFRHFSEASAPTASAPTASAVNAVPTEDATFAKKEELYVKKRAEYEESPTVENREGQRRLTLEKRPSRGTEPSWNAWFERGGVSVNVLKPNARYELIVDLSLYRYFGELSARVGRLVSDRINDEKMQPSLRLKVRGFSLDGKLYLTDVEQELEVTLSRLFDPPPDSEDQLVDRYLAGSISVGEFAHGVQAGEARFVLVTRETGCAAVALSIWDETGLFPLDHLVISVPVAEKGSPIPSCGTAAKPRAVIEKNAATLLQTSIERGPLEPLPVASFHLFETNVLDRPRTVVIMTDRAAYEASGGVKGSYTWLTQSLLSDYIARPEQLRVQIDEARKRATTQGYAAVARELSSKLFSQESGGDDMASLAREALRKAVAESSDPAVVVRMVTASGERAYLPLGLLGASSDAPVVKRPMLVIEPLPLERYPSARACIGQWTIAIPDHLDGIDRSELSRAAQFTQFAQRLKTEQDLSRYIEGEAPSSSPEGLILLAHHGSGYLWFADMSQRVGYEKLARRFPPGSVAMLSACVTATPGGDNLAWMTKLNRLGIDAMVVSPFPVPATYATKLALEFGAAVQTARESKLTPSFLELFKTATRSTADYFRAAYGANYDDLALEFVVAGDPTLRLCPVDEEE